jgi:DNA repair protein RadD
VGGGGGGQAVIALRDYQRAAIDALYAWFRAGRGSPLVVAPTGSGKSVILAEFARSAVVAYPDTRILIVTHVRELIAQNHAALIRLWPDAPAGICSAGLGKRQLGRQILVAGVQSVARRAQELGHVDLAIVDEAHLVPRSSDTQYGRLIEGLRDINPNLKVIGLTATPYRLDSGLLHRGENALFDGIAYDIPVAMLVARGHLAPLISKRPAAVFDTAGLHPRMGEFVERELMDRFGGDATRAAVAEIVGLGCDRRSWIAFCISVEHALAVRDGLRAHGIAAEAVTGATPGPERDRLLRAYKAGQLRALTSVGVLTTGFDAPATDLIAMLRPTASTGLYIQMAGRGMRTAPGKDDCLVLDFAGNVIRHGPVDAIALPEPKKGGTGLPGEPPARVCPRCDAIVAISARECLDCGHAFPPPEPKIEATATTEAIMVLTAPDEWQEIRDIAYRRHRKAGAPDSLRVDYLVGTHVVSEWVCIEHTGYAREKALAWWHQRGAGPPPDTVDAALARLDELRRPVEAVLVREGRYHRIKRVRFAHPEERAA